MQQQNQGISRRSLVASAAWSVPVIAAAVALPMAAASGNNLTNREANYYWAAEAQGGFTALEAAAGGLMATFSTQIGYRATPWASPPAGASLVVVVQFSAPVTLDPERRPGAWVPSPPSGSMATTFTFTRTPASFGDALTFNVVGSSPGRLESKASMSVLNGGSTTWASEPSSQTAVLVA